METGNSLDAGTGGTTRPNASDQVPVAASLSPQPTIPTDKSDGPADSDVRSSLTTGSSSNLDMHQASGHEDSEGPGQSLHEVVQNVDLEAAEKSSALDTRDSQTAEPQSHAVKCQVDCECYVCREYVHLARKLLKKLDDDAKEESDDSRGDEEQDEKNKNENQIHPPDCLCRECLGVKLRQLEKNRPDSDFISYSVEYLDVDDISIKTEPWPHAFDLAASRVLPGAHSSKGSMVFSVTTILATSMPAYIRHARYEFREMMTSKILQDPGNRVTVKGTRLRIHSPAIMNSLRSVVTYYPGISLWHEAIEINEPFCIIAHHLDDLERHKALLLDEKEDSVSRQTCEKLSVLQAGEHLSMLFTYIKDVYKGRLEQERERYERGMCTFQMLWLLFKPGKTVYFHEDHHDLSAHVIQQVNVDSSILYESVLGRTSIVVEMWHLDYNGREVGRCSKVVDVKPFDGERLITSLNVFPCEYQDNRDGNKTRDNLINYGRNWYKYLAVDQLHYSGRLWNSRIGEVSTVSSRADTSRCSDY